MVRRKEYFILPRDEYRLYFTGLVIQFKQNTERSVGSLKFQIFHIFICIIHIYKLKLFQHTYLDLEREIIGNIIYNKLTNTCK